MSSTFQFQLNKDYNNRNKSNPFFSSVFQPIEEDFQKEDTLKNPQPVEKWKILNKK